MQQGTNDGAFREPLREKNIASHQTAERKALADKGVRARSFILE